MGNEFWQRLSCDAASKLKLHVSISLWIMLCYYPPQHFPLREPVLLKPDLLPFLPDWAVIYQSVILLHTYAIWGAENARTAWKYVRELAVAFAVGAVFFWLWPTRIERPRSTFFVAIRVAHRPGRRDGKCLSLTARSFWTPGGAACAAAPWAARSLAVARIHACFHTAHPSTCVARFTSRAHARLGHPSLV
jgi:hypothetical protein